MSGPEDKEASTLSAPQLAPKEAVRETAYLEFPAEHPPGGAKAGHASLMRPNRPLSMLPFAKNRYAATRTMPRRLSRPK